MKTSSVVIVGLLCAGTAWAAPKDSCEAMRKDVTVKWAGKCPDEEAAAKKASCTDSIDDLNAMIKIQKGCSQRMLDAAMGKTGSTGAKPDAKPDAKEPVKSEAKTVKSDKADKTSGSAASSATPAASSSMPAKDIAYEGSGDTECSAVAPDGSVIAAFRSDSHTACGELLRDKVKTDYCAKMGKGSHKYTKVSSSKHVPGKPSELSVYCK